MRRVYPVLAAILLVLPAISAAAILDRESIECLSCHDATLSTDPGVMTICSEPDCDHPVGLDYLFLSSRNHGLRAPSLLDPSIRLADGYSVGCATCHVPYSSQNHSLLASLRSTDPNTPDPMLSMDNSGSRLCLACHLK